MPIRQNDIQRDLRKMHQQLDHAQFLADRALGKVPSILVGKSVRVRPEARHQLQLADAVFTITEMVGEGVNTMTKLTAPDGRTYKWFRAATELMPALAKGTMDTKQEEDTMLMQRSTDPGTKVLALANTIAKERRLLLRDAVTVVQREHPEVVQQYRDQYAVVHDEPPAAESAMSLRHGPPGESFMELATRIQREQRVDLRHAIHLAGQARPDLAERHLGG